ncbi:winged helix-turn-helix transcriptional regulator [Conyzicola nivalis]|nr:helix-turn-helix domain-containing protein [Conyzicola nivalis]
MKSSHTLRSSAGWNQVNEDECRHASQVLEVVGQRWSPSILLALARGAERYSDIMAVVAGLSARMLTLRLKQLETAELVARTVVPTTPVMVRYHLTPRGDDLITALQPIAGHVQRWEIDGGQSTPSS